MSSFRRVIRKGVMPCLQKTFSFSVILSLVMQPMAAPILLGAFVLSNPTKVLAQETAPVEEVAPVVEEESAPAEEEVAPEETPVEIPAEESTPAEEVTPVTPEEVPEVISPTEEVVTPTSDDQTKTEEDKKTEEVSEAESLEGDICLSSSQSITETTDADWTLSDDGKKASTKENIALGVEYRFSGNEDVTVTFTCLPKDESKRNPLSIEELDASDIHLPAGVVAAGEYAYDITTEMENGTFKYDLELPKIASGDFDISYIEKSAEEVIGEDLDKKDIKKISSKKVSNTSDSIEATELDHFTIFFPTVGVVCQNDVNGVNDVTGQKDLTLMCRSTNNSTSVSTKWDWDDIAWSGGNTGDACNLFDTDNDGNVNYAICVTIGGAPAVIQSTTRYSCGDDKPDRCSNKVLLPLSINTVCEVSTANTDPFSAGDAYPSDTQAICSIDLADVGGASSAKLIDVCSYPSQEPNAAPSDCIVATQASTGKIEIVKSLVPVSDGGTFNLLVDGTVLASSIGNGGTTAEQVVLAAAGGGTTHTFAETGANGTTLTNYTTTVSCKDNNGIGSVVSTTGSNPWSINVVKDKDIICTITNTRISNASLTIIKDAAPDDAQDFAFTSNIPTATSFSLDDDSDNSLSNTKIVSGLAAGTYNVSETVVTGWTQTSAICSDGSPLGAINLSAGENVTCTFVNTLQKANLTLIKNVITNNGGTTAATTWTLSAAGPTPLSGITGSGAVTNAAVTNGTYTLSESGGPSGYTASAWSCTGVTVNASSQITLAPGQSTTCTITNDDQAPTLTLIKEVNNNNISTGTALPSAWTLTATSAGQNPTNLSGTSGVTSGATFKADTYTLAEINGSIGYTAGSWNCTNNISVTNNQITLGAGQNTTCTIVNTRDTGTLRVLKNVDLNGDGDYSDQGETGATNWLWQDNGGANHNTGDAALTVGTGTYALTESSQTNFHQVGLSCIGGTLAGNTVTVTKDANAVCTFVNARDTGRLQVVKVVDDGSNLTEWSFSLDGATPVQAAANGQVDFGQVTTSDTHTITENGPTSSYQLTSVSGTNCARVGSTLTANATVVKDGTTLCTFSNAVNKGSITIVKNATPDDIQDFSFTTTGSGLSNFSLDDDGNNTNELSNTKTFSNLFPGAYGVTEGILAGWDLTGTVCTSSKGDTETANDMSLQAGENITCTFTNTKKGHLIVQKTTDPAGDGTSFTINTTSSTGGTITGGGAGVVTDATDKDYEVTPGTYSVSENLPAGWMKTDDTCQNVVVGAGETKTCTITNTKLVNIRIIKDALPDDVQDFVFTNNFGLGQAPTFTLDDDADGTRSNTSQTFDVLPSQYTVSEAPVTGWNQTGATCSNGSNPSSIQVTAGESLITCTFTNTKAANLTLVKNLVKDNGGTAVNTNWTLNAVGPTPISGITGSGAVTNAAVTNGTYTLSESGGPSGYTASVWSCTNNTTVTNSQITLTPGQNTTCTITNDDIAPQLTVIKHVVNDNGGTKNAGNFTMNVTGTSVSNSSFPGSESGITVTLNVGAYSVDETATSGYTKTLGDSCSGTIVLGETKTCTITNDDQQAYIIVDKTVDNKNGGSANADDFKLTVDDNAVLDTVAYAVNPGIHTASETNLPGYAAGEWGGDCDSEGSVTVALGETKTCSITNDDIFGRIIIQKETLPDEDQTPFSFTTSYNQEGFDLSDGQNSDSGILIPDTYSVVETETLGWDLASATCDDGSNPASISLQSNETVTCTFTNEKHGQVIVTKVDDVDEDGVFDEGEGTLSNWEMNLGQTSQKTVEGTTTFTNLIKGEYTLGETGQTGWNQTNIYCLPIEREIPQDNQEIVLDELPQEEANPTISFVLNPGETKECFVLNHFVDPLLTIEKSNDSFPAVEAPGDVVTYTLKVKVTENSVEEVTLTDLPPAGFTYVAGSATASTDNISHTGTTPALTHEYASPGVWSLGDVADGETITLTYQARISGSQDEGIYNDLAYAGGSSARGAQVLATDVSDSDNFADTRVAVALAETNKVKIDEDKEVETDKKKEYVLGAALPATGATTSLLALAFALMLAGGVLILSDRRKKLMKVFVLGMVMVGSLFGGAAKAAAVPEGLAVSMEDPDAAVTSSNFKIGFVALDIQGKDLGRTVEIACFSGAVQYASYTLIPGGSSGDCQVNSTAMPVAGAYDFYVTATVSGEGGGTLESNHALVKLVTGAPGTPREYERDEATCDDKISFRTDSDGGRTVKVEAYRSKNKTFTADSSTLVATLAIGSNTEGTITTTPPSCNEDYWYAIRAVDTDGIGSDFVGDVDVNVTNKTSTTTITTPGASASGGALSVNEGSAGEAAPAGTVEGAATEGDAETGVLGEMTGDESQDQAGTWNWVQNHKGWLSFLLLVMGGILYYFFYVRRTASSGQGN